MVKRYIGNLVSLNLAAAVVMSFSQATNSERPIEPPAIKNGHVRLKLFSSSEDDSYGPTEKEKDFCRRVLDITKNMLPTTSRYVWARTISEKYGGSFKWRRVDPHNERIIIDSIKSDIQANFPNGNVKEIQTTGDDPVVASEVPEIGTLYEVSAKRPSLGDLNNLNIDPKKNENGHLLAYQQGQYNPISLIGVEYVGLEPVMLDGKMYIVDPMLMDIRRVLMSNKSTTSISICAIIYGGK